MTKKKTAKNLSKGKNLSKVKTLTRQKFHISPELSETFKGMGLLSKLTRTAHKYPSSPFARTKG